MNIKKKMSTLAAIAAASTIALSMMGTSASAYSNRSFTEISASYDAGSIAYSNTSYQDGKQIVEIARTNGYTDVYIDGRFVTTTTTAPITAQTVNAVEEKVINSARYGIPTDEIRSYTTTQDYSNSVYTEVTDSYGRLVTYQDGVFLTEGQMNFSDRTYCDDITHAQSNGAQKAEAQAREGALRGQAAMSAEAARTQATQTATQTTSTPASNKNTTQTANNTTSKSTRNVTANGILVVTQTYDSSGRLIKTTTNMEQPKTNAEIRAVQREKNKAVASSNASSSSSASSNRNTSTSTSTATSNGNTSTTNRTTSTSSSSASSSRTTSTPTSAVQQKVAEQAAAGAARGAAAMAQYANSTSSKNYNAAQQAAQQKAAEQAAAGAARGAAAMAQYANKK